MRSPTCARWGAIYLLVQALGATLWWLMLWCVPASRVWFRPHDAPDSVLLSFFLPDAIGFIGLGLWAVLALWRNARRAVLPLALHVGAATYAALYYLQQWLMSGEAPLAALLMWPALVVGPLSRFPPLSIDATNRLVVRGSYRWVRDSMAIGSLTQGAALGRGVRALSAACALLAAAIVALLKPIDTAKRAASTCSAL